MLPGELNSKADKKTLSNFDGAVQKSAAKSHLSDRIRRSFKKGPQCVPGPPTSVTMPLDAVSLFGLTSIFILSHQAGPHQNLSPTSIYAAHRDLSLSMEQKPPDLRNYEKDYGLIPPGNALQKSIQLIRTSTFREEKGLGRISKKSHLMTKMTNHSE
ncbi:hypothetical protein E5288_WYG016763 [Bos mutus]|uniref:Uncharacterized protein n=1 Tax=Bos mutus TaxID=72004 RepID=A0A6B0R9G2_9CETA|nr:hypothetical protein [Bos mutus]